MRSRITARNGCIFGESKEHFAGAIEEQLFMQRAPQTKVAAISQY